VTLTNTGNTVLNITNILGGPNAQDFSQTTTCSSQVNPGGSCSFSVTFTATKGGSRSATLSITDDGGGSPQKVLLSWTGTYAARRTIGCGLAVADEHFAVCG